MNWKDVRLEWHKDPEYAEALRDEFPYRALADAVVGLRARFSLTQQQLAEMVGTQQPVIARLESGKHPVEIRMIQRIADAIGVDWRIVFSARDEHASSRVESLTRKQVTSGPHRSDRSAGNRGVAGPLASGPLVRA